MLSFVRSTCVIECRIVRTLYFCTHPENHSIRLSISQYISSTSTSTISTWFPCRDALQAAPTMKQKRASATSADRLSWTATHTPGFFEHSSLDGINIGHALYELIQEPCLAQRQPTLEKSLAFVCPAAFRRRPLSHLPVPSAYDIIYGLLRKTSVAVLSSFGALPFRVPLCY